MSFLDSISIVKKRTTKRLEKPNIGDIAHEIRFEDTIIMTINTGRILMLVPKFIDTADISYIFKGCEIGDQLFDNKARLLEGIYTNLRRKKLRNNHIKNIPMSDVAFKHFRKASEIINRHKTTPKKFMEAQLDGLKFLMDKGKLAFPSPNYLSNSAAETRFLEYIAKIDASNVKDKIDRIELGFDDKRLELMENPKFKAVFSKFQKNTATLQELYYINDCMLHRKGYVTDTVLHKITELENASND